MSEDCEVPLKLHYARMRAKDALAEARAYAEIEDLIYSVADAYREEGRGDVANSIDNYLDRFRSEEGVPDRIDMVSSDVFASFNRVEEHIKSADDPEEAYQEVLDGELGGEVVEEFQDAVKDPELYTSVMEDFKGLREALKGWGVDLVGRGRRGEIQGSADTMGDIGQDISFGDSEGEGSDTYTMGETRRSGGKKDEENSDIHELDVEMDILTRDYEPEGFWDRLSYHMGGDEQRAFVRLSGQDMEEYVEEYLSDLEQDFDATVFTEYQDFSVEGEDEGERFPDFKSIRRELDAELIWDEDSRIESRGAYYMPLAFEGEDTVPLNPGESLWIEGSLSGDKYPADPGEDHDELAVPRLADSADSAGHEDNWGSILGKGVDNVRSTIHSIDTHPIIAGRNPGVWGENERDEQGKAPTMMQRWKRSKKKEPQPTRDIIEKYADDVLIAGAAHMALGGKRLGSSE